jgi:hypothetical protein
MARNQRRLEKLTLNEDSFQSMFAKFQDDVDAHTWSQFEGRLGELAHTIRTELKNCPYFARLVEILMRIKSIYENQAVYSDMGSDAEWAAWW